MYEDVYRWRMVMMQTFGNLYALYGQASTWYLYYVLAWQLIKLVIGWTVCIIWRGSIPFLYRHSSRLSTAQGFLLVQTLIACTWRDLSPSMYKERAKWLFFSFSFSETSSVFHTTLILLSLLSNGTLGGSESHVLLLSVVLRSQLKN